MSAAEGATVNSDQLCQLYEYFLSGAVEKVAELFAGGPNLDTPKFGVVDRYPALQRCVQIEQEFLTSRNAVPKVINQIDTPERSVVEFAVALDVLDNPLPVAVFGNCAGDGFGALRTYHNTSVYNGHFTARPQLLAVATPPVPPVIRDYFQAVYQAPSVERVMSVYAEDQVMVAPSGAWRQGKDEIRPVYERFLKDGRIALHHCTETDNGASCAIEWACDQWGRRYPALESGCAIYDYAGEKLFAARIYDDLKPPFRTEASAG